MLSNMSKAVTVITSHGSKSPPQRPQIGRKRTRISLDASYLSPVKRVSVSAVMPDKELPFPILTSSPVSRFAPSISPKVSVS